MIDLSPEHLQTVVNTISRYMENCEVRVFGSRVTGEAKSYSDLDLALVAEEKIDWRKLELLKDAFAESNLPFMVDLVDWHDLSPQFKSRIEQWYEVIELHQG